MTFEQAMEELESLVGKLQSGKIPLDEAVSKYEEGKKKVQFCKRKLQEAKEKIVSLDDASEASPTQGEEFTKPSSSEGSKNLKSDPNEDIPF